MSMMVTHSISCPFVHLERVVKIAHYAFFSRVPPPVRKKKIIVRLLHGRKIVDRAREKIIERKNHLNDQDV